MKNTLALFIILAVVSSAFMGFSAAANTNDVNGITASSSNINLQEQAAISKEKVASAAPNVPQGAAAKKIPLQKTGVPIAPALLSTLLIGSGLLYGRLRKVP